MSVKERFSEYIDNLQDEICSAIEQLDGRARFREDLWERAGGGGGRTRVIENGRVFEKGGVNISRVHGELPEPIRKNFNVDYGWFWAGGLSLVIHPENPMVPTIHANYRYFELYEDPAMKTPVDGWFGGGADLTPYYLWEGMQSIFTRRSERRATNMESSSIPGSKNSVTITFLTPTEENGAEWVGYFTIT